MNAPVTETLLWTACLAGREPAESLSTAGRERLVVLLAVRGWSDVEIAAWTRQTTYTTNRIRRRAELRAAERRERCAAA